MKKEDYQHIEELLIRLLNMLVAIFSESELKEVQDFIDVGEYGLALETLVDIVAEENKKIPRAAIVLVKELSTAMLLDESVFDNKLRWHVID
ncbi:MAG: MafI family immunity protein [Gammaproteobacteria bacterium]|nr:MafI family immunity protein [Gammaproteobacteria bacterium]